MRVLPSLARLAASRLAKLACAVAPLLEAGCSHKAPEDVAPSASARAAAVPVGPRRPVVMDAIAGFDACTLGHRGVLLDLGDRTMRGRYGAKLDTPDPESVEHEGATWARATSKSITGTFYWSDELTPPPVAPADAGPSNDSGTYVEARIASVSARSVSIYLNGKIVSSPSLVRGETKVVLARGGPGTVFAGANEVTLRFNGSNKSEDDVVAEVDWIHVGQGDPLGDDSGPSPPPAPGTKHEDTYSAPTRADAMIEATVGGVPRRALSLRAPGFVRCEGYIPQGATVEADLALAGQGEADIEVRLLRDRSTPVVLGDAHVSSGASGWTRVQMPVGDVDGGTLGAIEIAPLRSTRGVRVLLGEPRVIGPEAPAVDPAPLPPSRGVVLIVWSGVVSRSLGPYGGDRAVPELSLLASEGILFGAHRATTALASGALSSMLTGLPARAHTVTDPSTRLPHGLMTVADAVKVAGVRTALFTANPTTGPAFGFDRGWDTYVSHAPGDDTPATQIFDEAAKWIDGHKEDRFLVVLHARGGHPPWDATTDEMKPMPPANYGGSIDPKHAAEILAKDKKFPQRLTAADRERVWALYANAIEAHDTALGTFLGALRAAGRDADTTIIASGDVSASDSATVPFTDGDALDEAVLSAPLIVRPPVSAGLGGLKVTSPTSGDDVAKTILGALGLDAPPSFGGVDLRETARREGGGEARALVATGASRFALRWGSFVLAGTRDHETKLCDLSLEPSCLTDVRKTYPLALDLLHVLAYDLVGPMSDAKVSREPAFLDPLTMAGLYAWGRPGEKKKHSDRD